MRIRKILIAAILIATTNVFGAGSFNSPNMGLVIPIPGQETGPQWAEDINASLNLIDLHDHSPGNGVQITPNGLDINIDLPFNNNRATFVSGVQFEPPAVAPTGAGNLGQIYEFGTDLYYNDGAGNQIRITQGGSVSGSAGTITGLPSGTASAAYGSVSGTFTFLQSTSTGANIDAATYILRYPGSYPAPAGNYIALEAPSTLATGYAITFPNLPPSVDKSIVTENTLGGLSYTNVDNSTLQISGGVMAVAVSGITSAQIMPGAVGTPQIANQAVTAAKIANSTITGTQVVTNINLPGKSIQNQGQNVIVSSANATNQLQTVRGEFNASGAGLIGEGFIVSHTGTGIYTIGFTNSFGDTPQVLVTLIDISSAGCTYFSSTNPSAAIIHVYDNTLTPVDRALAFIAIGQRS